MATLDDLRAERNAAELELTKAWHELSAAQSRFAKARKRFDLTREAYIVESERLYGRAW